MLKMVLKNKWSVYINKSIENLKIPMIWLDYYLGQTLITECNTHLVNWPSLIKCSHSYETKKTTNTHLVNWPKHKKTCLSWHTSKTAWLCLWKVRFCFPRVSGFDHLLLTFCLIKAKYSCKSYKTHISIYFNNFKPLGWMKGWLVNLCPFQQYFSHIRMMGRW